MKSLNKNNPLKLALLGVMCSLCSCNLVGNFMNPFYEPPTELALQGEKNDHALSGAGTSDKAENARSALQAMGDYQRTHDPKPENPVIRPAIVRLMWVPDHLNKSGDLVPSHYYYLKVKKEDWAVTDAFDNEAQLNQSGGGQASAFPFVIENSK